MRTLRIMSLIAIAIAALVAPARAASITLVVDGEPAVKPRVHDAAIAWLGRRGWPLGTRELDHGAEQKLASCLLSNKEEGCFSAVTQGAGSDRTLFIEAAIDQQQEGSGTVVLTGWLLTREGHFLATERQYCERCTDDGITKATTDLLDLVQRSAALKLGTTLLRVHSVPSGARVMIDNDPIGVTDLEFATYPGPHTISVDKPGFQIEVRHVNAQEDASTPIDVQMVPQKDGGAQAGASAHHHGGRGALPWVLLGAGAVALATGGVLLASDEKQPTNGAGDEKYDRQRALVPAIAALGAGAVLVGGGLYLYVSRGHDTATGDAVAIGLGGSF